MVYLSKKDKAAIFGMILGDGYLQSTGKRNARLRLEHSQRQKDYIMWKISLLPRLFLGKSKAVSRIHPKTKRVYHYFRHQSNSTPYLGKLRKIFYPRGKKYLPDKLPSIIKHPIALAVWYMDDGYYYPRDKSSFLYLGKVSRTEAETASKVFRIFGTENKVIDKKTKGFILYFPHRALKSLNELIGDFIIPSMRYKLPF